MTFYQADISRAGESILEKSDKLVSTIGMLGATLVGVGAFLAVGANWDFIPGLLKIALIVSCTVASYLFGWMMKNPSGKGGKPRIGEALIFLGTMLYGVGIWQIAQIYGYDIEFSWGILLWALGIIPVAIVTRSGFVAVLACSLLNYWLLMEPYSLTNCAVWAVLSFSLAYFVRSPWALAKGLVGAAVWAVDAAHLGAGGLVYLGLAMCVWYLFHANTKSLINLSKPYLYVGSFVTLVSLLALTDERGRFFFSDSPDLFPLIIIHALLVVAGLFSFRYWNRIRPELIGCALIAILAFGISFIFDSVLHSALAHGLLMASVLAFVSTAILRIRSSALMIMSSMFFTFAVTALYFDSKFTMSIRSMFLLAGGVLLITAAGFIEKQLRGRTFQPKQNRVQSRSMAL